jgi:hypothetical protein
VVTRFRPSDGSIVQVAKYAGNVVGAGTSAFSAGPSRFGEAATSEPPPKRERRHERGHDDDSHQCGVLLGVEQRSVAEVKR